MESTLMELFVDGIVEAWRLLASLDLEFLGGPFFYLPLNPADLLLLCD